MTIVGKHLVLSVPFVLFETKKARVLRAFLRADIRLLLGPHCGRLPALTSAVSLFTHAPAVRLELLLGSWFDRPVTGRAAHHGRQTMVATTLPLPPLQAAAAVGGATRWVLVESARMEKPPLPRCQ